jgi:hypothetical protein
MVILTSKKEGGDDDKRRKGEKAVKGQTSAANRPHSPLPTEPYCPTIGPSLRRASATVHGGLVGLEKVIKARAKRQQTPYSTAERRAPALM